MFQAYLILLIICILVCFIQSFVYNFNNRMRKIQKLRIMPTTDFEKEASELGIPQIYIKVES